MLQNKAQTISASGVRDPWGHRAIESYLGLHDAMLCFTMAFMGLYTYKVYRVHLLGTAAAIKRVSLSSRAKYVQN